MNRLDELIKEGETVRDSANDDAYGVGKFLTGEALETWTSKCVIFMDETSDNMFLSEKVKENAKNINNKGYEKCLAILGVLKAIKESTQVNS